MLNVDIIAGARPNFMKIVPIIHAIEKSNKQHPKKINYRLIHTGQHYDFNMSGSFLKQLNIPEPQVYFEVGSGTQGKQMGKRKNTSKMGRKIGY
jgi:UDP-N-acetylglucosamine 2-epimerase (non-hydrolysing)